jgi:hypothetical protein
MDVIGTVVGFILSVMGTLGTERIAIALTEFKTAQPRHISKHGLLPGVGDANLSARRRTA